MASAKTHSVPVRPSSGSHRANRALVESPNHDVDPARPISLQARLLRSLADHRVAVRASSLRLSYSRCRDFEAGIAWDSGIECADWKSTPPESANPDRSSGFYFVQAWAQVSAGRACLRTIRAAKELRVHRAQIAVRVAEFRRR